MREREREEERERRERESGGRKGARERSEGAREERGSDDAEADTEVLVDERRASAPSSTVLVGAVGLPALAAPSTRARLTTGSAALGQSSWRVLEDPVGTSGAEGLCTLRKRLAIRKACPHAALIVSGESLGNRMAWSQAWMVFMFSVDRPFS